ncbi:MAG: YfhO family protein [Planctomycetia bacterium]|nr:YfhO family protein [Planctomycetia bacterium]
MSKSHLFVIGLVGGLLVWLFAPALLVTHSFVFRDAAHYYHPLFEFIRDQWFSARLPLWNPYDNLGMSLVGESTSSVFYPGKLIFFLPLDFTLLYNFYIISHLGLAAWTSYLLARHWGESILAAGFAAICYAFSGNVLFQYSNVVFLVGAAWLPCALLLADRMLVKRRRQSALALGIVLSLMILGGDPQMAYNVLLLTALYAVQMRRAGRSGSDPTATGAKPTWTAHRATLCAISAATCLVLAAVQILPTMESSRLSRRASYDSPRSLVELLLPRGDDRDEGDMADSPHPHPLPKGEGSTQVPLRSNLEPIREPSRRRGQSHFAPRPSCGWCPPQNRDSPRRFSDRLLDQPAWYAGLLGTSPDGHQRQVYQFSVGPWRVFEFLWPNLSGRQFPTHRRWLSALPAEGRAWVPSLYMGLLPFLLAVVSWSVRAPDVRVRWLSWIVLLTALGSFGIYGCGWAIRELKVLCHGSDTLAIGDEVGGLYWLITVLLPGYIYFRYPAKLLVLAALGLSMLAARGWDEIFQRPNIALHRVLLGLVALSLIGLGVVLVFWPTLSVMLDRMPADPLFGPFDAAGAWRDIAGGLVQTAVLSAIFLALFRRRADAPAGSFVRATALAITVADLALAQSWLLPYAPSELWRTEPGVARVMPRTTDGYRIYREPLWLPDSWHRTSSPNRQLAIMSWERETLSPKYHLPYRLSVVEASGTMVPLEYQVMLDVARAHGEPGPAGPRPHDSVLDLAGARFSLLPEEITAKDPTHPDDRVEGLTVRSRDQALPRSWIVHQVEVLPALSSRAPSRVRRRTEQVLFPAGRPRDWRRVAVIETDQPLPLTPEPKPAWAKETCELVHSDPMRVEVAAHLASPGVVVLSDLDFPGWELTVETGGTLRPAPIWRANRLMRGAVLPAGDHRLVYRYRPRSVFYGGAISGLSAMSLAVGAAVVRRRRHALKRLRQNSPAAQI